MLKLLTKILPEKLSIIFFKTEAEFINFVSNSLWLCHPSNSFGNTPKLIFACTHPFYYQQKFGYFHQFHYKCMEILIVFGGDDTMQRIYKFMEGLIVFGGNGTMQRSRYYKNSFKLYVEKFLVHLHRLKKTFYKYIYSYL